MQARSPTGKFDFIKLNIEGEELEVLSDPESRTVLCEATCFFLKLHETTRPGCSAALWSFLQEGCDATGQVFTEVSFTGEYSMYCQVCGHTREHVCGQSRPSGASVHALGCGKVLLHSAARGLLAQHLLMVKA